MQVPTESFNNLMAVLAAILKIGNINFVTAGGAQISDKSGKCESYIMRLSPLCSTRGSCFMFER